MPADKPAPTHEQISEQIKASAHARVEASLLEGRKEQLAILQAGQTPSEDLCQARWDRKSTAEQHALVWANWITGCFAAPDAP
ncbi:hypothetical protein ACFWVC_11360 [Streptomyces sp. NPDC058691]|uniref:hypothetical protein n=1 Tax=Streptomyces sp. NPDC058691 TaxID=3346601 RepID=UPI0036461B6B